ncbi:hypothetical protein OAM67_00800 [bacterium]|nr:hypothetical protein [bacterium]
MSLLATLQKLKYGKLQDRARKLGITPLNQKKAALIHAIVDGTSPMPPTPPKPKRKAQDESEHDICNNHNKRKRVKINDEMDNPQLVSAVNEALDASMREAYERTNGMSVEIVDNESTPSTTPVTSPIVVEPEPVIADIIDIAPVKNSPTPATTPGFAEPVVADAIDIALEPQPSLICQHTTDNPFARQHTTDNPFGRQHTTDNPFARDMPLNKFTIVEIQTDEFGRPVYVCQDNATSELFHTQYGVKV